MQANRQSDDADIALKLAKVIAPLLAGHPGPTQGAVLAELLSIWLAGHPNFTRNQLIRQHIRVVRKLTIVNENIIFNGKGHPQNTKDGGK